MVRRVLKSHLKIADLHLAETTALIAKQEDVLAKLEADGHHTLAARQLLKQFRDLLLQHQSDWERFRKQIGKEK
jgi:hypothetical protein